MVISSSTSEIKLQRQLHFQRIPNALTQEAVKVKQSWRDQRIHIVLVVEAVKHLHLGSQDIAIAEMEGAGRAPVEGEETIVLPEMVASAINSIHHPGQRVVNAAGSS